jgi:hypothetical protein
MRALWLPDGLREFGVHFVETSGWKTRGADTFEPKVVIAHHDAIPGPASAPGVHMVTVGRSDLAGPLCQVYLGRDGTAYIIASGRANHAGTGGWKGIQGNTNALGIEAANNGLGEPWPQVQLEAYYRIVACMLKHIGRDASFACGHKEWAPTRKIDPKGIDMNQFRAEVAKRLGNPTEAPHPQVTINPPVYVGTLEEKTVRATVEVATDAQGNGFGDFPNLSWNNYRGVSVQGFDPPFLHGYKNPVVTAHNIDNHVRVVVTEWIPNNKATVHVNMASV